MHRQACPTNATFRACPDCCCAAKPLRLVPRQGGFGLIEVLLVMALIGLGLGMTLPDNSHQQTAQALRAVVHDYRASLLYARRQASALNSPVTVCPSSDGQRCTEAGLEQGWIVRAGGHHEADAPLLRDHPPQPNPPFQTRWAQSAKHITFLPNGLAQGGSLRRINLCPKQAPTHSLHLPSLTPSTPSPAATWPWPAPW